MDNKYERKKKGLPKQVISSLLVYLCEWEAVTKRIGQAYFKISIYWSMTAWEGIVY